MRTITSLSALLPVSRPSRPLIRILVCLLIATAIYCCTFAVSMADAATYYLNNSIGDDSYNGLAPQYDGNNGPWLTLTHTKTVVNALSTKGCGSTVIVYQGTGSTYGIYDEGNTTSEITRTGPEYLTYQAAPGETPIFSGIQVIVAGANYRTSYLDFNGIEITPGTSRIHSGLTYGNDGVFLQQVGQIYLNNLTVIGTGYNASNTNYPSCGIYAASCNDINITNCNIYGTTPPIVETGWEFGIYSKMTNRVNVINCNITQCAEGILGWGDSWNILNNNLHNLDSDGILIEYVSNLVIANNLIHDMTPPLILNDSSGASYNSATYTITANSGTPYALPTTESTVNTLDYYLRFTATDTNGSTVYLPDADPIAVSTNYGIWYAIASATPNTITLSPSATVNTMPTKDYNNITNIQVVRGYHTDGIQLQDMNSTTGQPFVNSFNLTLSGNTIYNSNRQGLHIWPYNYANHITLENNLIYNTNDDYQFGADYNLILINNTGRECDFRNGTTVALMASNIFSNIWIDSNTPDVNYEDYDIVESFSSRIHHDPNFTPGVHTIDFSNYGDGNSPETFAQWKAIFKDYNNRDFTLAKNSCAIGHADPNNHTATDILEVVRDSSPDAGCYEYSAQTYTLNTTAVNGTVAKSPDKTNYNSGDTVTLQATPNAGYAFANWSGDVCDTNSSVTTIIMNSNKSVTANFVDPPTTYTLSITAINGSVTKTPDKTSYNYGDTVTLTATPNTGYAFANWSGDASGSSNPVTITMNSNKSITANFAVQAPTTYTLSIIATNGSVTKTPDKTGYNYGDTVILQATPNTGYAFANWSGDASDTNSSVTITMNSNKSITANFAVQASTTYTLSIIATNGSVTKTPDKTGYNYGDTVILQATPNTGYAFANWSGDASGSSNPVTITMNTNKSVTANFNAIVDNTAPSVTGLSPAANSIQVPLDRLVILHVTDNGEGVDANSVTIKVNDNIVYTGDTADYNSPYGYCHRTGAKADYTFIYQPNTAFDYDQNVSVVVNAQDLAGNAMSQYSYSFVTETRSFGENKMVNSSSKNIGNGHPATVRDSAGNIWVAWHAGPVSSSGMKRGIYVGKLPAGADTFGNSVREANNTSDRCNAALAIDAYDKLYLAWQDNRQKKWDIYMSTSVDGINWSTETRVTDSDSNAINPVIAVDHSMPPKAYIAWQDDRTGNQEIYIASSSDGFATETISKITSDSSDHIKPAIAVDSANTVYVVWADSRNGSSDIYGAASNNGPWSNVPIVTKPGNQTNPAIATEATGTILHLLWVDDTAGNKDIYYAASNGLPETSLAGRNIVDDNSGADQLTPVIITTGSTGAGLRVFACWQDMRNIIKSGNTDLYFVDVNHGKETNIFVSNNATSSNQSAPAIGVDRYGYPYLVWVDDRNQNIDIYYAGSTFVHSNAMASQNVSPASDAIIGTEPANITGVDDVSVAVPAGAYPCELNITISKVENPPKLPVSLFTFPYEFGPSGMDFNQPVTITIPYSVSASNNPAFAYWYNTLADALSQQGITNVETIAISPTLYAICFKTTHFSQFIVGGNISSSIQVTKCTIIAGSKDNSDKISISGKIDATADNFNNATAIEVTVDSNDMVNPCVLTFPINSKTLKKDKYSYSGTENGVKKSFKYDVKTHSFVSAANNVNLSGLDCPLTFDINVGDYIGTAEVNETIVNGQNKPIPIILLMGVKCSLKIDKCQVKPGNKKPNTDQLLVKGDFTVEDTDVNMANRIGEGLVVILGTQTFTIPTNELKAGKGKFTCSKAEVTGGGIAMVSFDFNKCSFMLTIRNTNITASSGTVDFGVAFAGYSQIRQITLM